MAASPSASWRERVARVVALMLVTLALAAAPGIAHGTEVAGATPAAASVSGEEFLAALPAADAQAARLGYVELNDGEPSFAPEDATTIAFESYAPLDELGRCGAALACVGPELMPTEERGDISEVHPSGWHQASYDFVDGESLYNRSHLIAFQLTGENANERNLITGTRHMNADAMRPLEEMVADYVHQTGNHVLYRVTPVFEGAELVARGVQVEALSMEDGGAGVRLNVFCYNAQPGVEIDYATGQSSQAAVVPDGTPEHDEAAAQQAVAACVGTPVDTESQVAPAQTDNQAQAYVLNTNTMKFHEPSCSSAAKIKPANRQDITASRDDLIAQGYVPCKRCNP